MQTGTPASLANNVAKLSPGYLNRFSWPELVLALAGTVAWLWLVGWRTGRHRHPLWKSLVLPAGGVSVCWLLVMTLLLPPLDNARSYRAMMQRISREVPAGSCVLAPGMPRAQVVALEYFGGYRVDATGAAPTPACDFLLLTRPTKAPAAPWQFVAREARNRRRDDTTDIFRRATGLIRGSARTDGQSPASAASLRVASDPWAGTRERTRTAGKTSRKVDPLPGSLSMSSSPPCRCMTCLTIASPSPVPPDSRERLLSTR